MSYVTTRKDTRYDFPSTIEYVLGSQADDEVARKGITIDLSTTGLCMYIFDPLPHGQKIIIKTALPVSSRTAAICWTRKEENSLYRSGLKFI
jgi:c-di-GMP-binding flagellar brake protein YcgR